MQASLFRHCTPLGYQQAHVQTHLQVTACGPKASIEPLKPLLDTFGSKYFFTDDVCPAFTGFGGA